MNPVSFPVDSVVRKSADYHPTVWGNYFISPAHPKIYPEGQMMQECSSDASTTEERVEKLKKQIRSMLEDVTGTDVLSTLDLINSIQLLGLDYHFEKEISEALDGIRDANIDNCGLYHTAMWFRLLRQHGYQVSSDIFNRFKDKEGARFRSSLKNDVKGLLSLYNAAYLGTHGETILEEAISFTKTLLTSVLSDLEPPLAKQVGDDLELPIYRKMKRLRARNYISIYEEDAARNDVLLELAKLDFNMLQSLHCEELKSISMWWNDLAPSTNFAFARDRIVESYFWMVGLYFEPYYSRARIISTKIFALVSILDDIYDNYSTLEESRVLTEGIQRWDANVVDQLPKCLKYFLHKLIHTFEEMEDMLKPNEKYRMFYLKEVMKQISRFYFEEYKWAVQNYIPTLEEHMQVSLITAGCILLGCVSFVGMGEIATKEAFEWVTSFPKFVKASAIIGRLLNDVIGHEFEQKREHVASTVQCYIKDYGINANTACEKLLCLVEDAWKDINEEWFDKNAFPKALLERIVNLSRTMETLYRKMDGFTNSSTETKEMISFLLVDPILI